jgi:Tol biopolymer transport system component
VATLKRRLNVADIRRTRVSRRALEAHCLPSLLSLGAGSTAILPRLARAESAPSNAGTSRRRLGWQYRLRHVNLRGKMAATSQPSKSSAGGIALSTLVVIAAVLTSVTPARPAPHAPRTPQLAYIADTAGGIWIVHLDGTGARRFRGTDNAFEFTVSPDGTRLAFAQQVAVPNIDQASDIWTIRADGMGLRRLTRGGVSANPVWSPNGKQIYYERLDAGWVMNADGTGKRQLPYSHASTTGLSPDGSRDAAILIDPEDHYQLYVSGRQITHNTSSYLSTQFSDPAWAPDGTTLAFITATDDRASLYVIGDDGGGERRIAQAAPGAPDAPAWSPDGTLIAFQGSTGRGTDVFVVRPDGTGDRRVTHGADAFNVAWVSTA